MTASTCCWAAICSLPGPNASAYMRSCFTPSNRNGPIFARLSKPPAVPVTDPVALSDLMAMQAQLKNAVAALLDKLMQADMEIAFNVKKDEKAGFLNGSAM